MEDIKSKLFKSSTLFLLALAIPSIIFIGCGKKESTASTASSPAETVLFVKGDPENLIRGARLNATSPFTTENIADLKAYSVLQIQEFQEKIEFHPDQAAKNKEDLERINETSEVTAPAQGQALAANVEVNQDDKQDWHLLLLSGTYDLTMKKDADGGLQPVSYVTKNQKFNLKSLHWSLTPDQRFISVLMRSEDAVKGRRLIALYFENTTAPMKLDLTDEKYVYANGKGVKIPWKNLPEKTLKISLCGESINQQSSAALVDGWRKALAGRMTLAVEKKIVFAPFSDLNEHCLQIVDSYIYEPDPGSAYYGATLSIQSFSKGEIVDADVMMFVKEFEKKSKELTQAGYSVEQVNQEIQKKYQLALGHEIGHLLGLGHKYGGTPSIMSYDFLYATPQPYDIEALSQLYPLR